MSSSGDGGKPAQLGLVDMGDIRFYDDPAYYPPSFNTSDLASYTGSFSEMVLNVAWQQLQPTQGGALDTAVIDSAIAAVTAYNAQHGTDLGIKLRVWGGYQAPEWAKNIDGPPITITGQATVDPYIYNARTIGRFWTADYVDAWSSLQNQLASRYDSNPLIRGISQTAGASATDEPFVSLQQRGAVSARPPHRTVNQIDQVQAAGYNDAAQMLTLRAAIADYAQWSHDAARLHDEPVPPVRQRQRAIDPQLHARRPAAGAELHPHGPGRQSRPERPDLLLPHLPLCPDDGGRRARSRGDASQLPDRFAGHACGERKLRQLSELHRAGGRLAQRRRQRHAVERRQYRALELLGTEPAPPAS